MTSNNYALGQLFMTGLSGVSLTKKEKIFLTTNNIGGVLLFKKNYQNPSQLAQLCNEIQTCRKDNPLFIAVDQEGGRVVRFSKPFVEIPAMKYLAEQNSPTLCFDLFLQLGKELKAVGVNLNLSPVCDVLFNPSNKVIGDRSFSNNPEVVSKFLTATIRGQKKAGILSCAKHFPGHGRTNKDSHFSLPNLKTSLDIIKSEELVSFKNAVKTKVEFVMMAHLQIDSIDSKQPTSISPNAYALLRKELNFNGIIITDDMQMGAITKKYEISGAARKAILSGADLLEYRDMDKTQEAFESIKKEILNNKLLKERVLESIERIYKLKINYFKNFSPVNISNLSFS